MEITIRNCTFKFRCDKQWQDLERTEDPKVRYCNSCEEEIHYVHTNKELRKAIEANQCVALVVEESYEQYDGPITILGRV